MWLFLLFFCSPFVTSKYFVRPGNKCIEQPEFSEVFHVFFVVNFSFYPWALVLSTEICSFSSERKVCWALKSWVFPVNEKRSLSEPEKLKISGRSTLEWTGKMQDFSAKHQGELIKLKWATKNEWKIIENWGCSMHFVFQAVQIILWAENCHNGAFTVEDWRNLHGSG